MHYEFTEEPYLHGLGCWFMMCGKCNVKLNNDFHWVWDGYNATVCTTICGKCCTVDEAREELKQYCNPMYIVLRTDKVKVEEPIYKIRRSSGVIEDGWMVSSQKRESYRFRVCDGISFANEPAMLLTTDSRNTRAILLTDGKDVRKYVEWNEFLELNGIRYFDPPLDDAPEHVKKI
jgi:hypothetical protein